MKWLNVIMFVFASINGLYAQNKAVDSAYNNWYYDSREKLYQHIKGQAVDEIFFGNSITERGPWHEHFAQYKVANRGIGRDYNVVIKARIGYVMLFKPKKIFLMIGINDIGRRLPTEITLKNCVEIIRIIQTTCPKTKIYVQSTLPLNEKLLKYEYLSG